MCILYQLLRLDKCSRKNYITDRYIFIPSFKNAIIHLNKSTDSLFKTWTMQKNPEQNKIKKHDQIKNANPKCAHDQNQVQNLHNFLNYKII